MINHKRDFHIHATAYRLGNPKPDHTVEALQHRCVELGLSVVGIGEHLNHAAKHPIECLRALLAEARRLKPPRVLTAFVGAEVDILDRAGTVTCSAAQKRELGLDYLLGSVHTNPKHCPDVDAYVEDELQRHLAVLKHCPHIDVLAHPWGMGRRWEAAGLVPQWSFELIPDDYQDCLIDAAVRQDKAIEINMGGKARSDDPGYVRFVCKLRDAGVKISVGSDAHAMTDIARALDICAYLEGFGIDDKQLWRPDTA